MNSISLRINCKHLQREIETDYLGIRNHLYLCVLASVCVMHFDGRVMPKINIEDSYYQSALDYAMRSPNTQSAIAHLGVVAPPLQFLEIHELVEDFLTERLVVRRKNYLSISIDSAYQLTVNLKLI